LSLLTVKNNKNLRHGKWNKNTGLVHFDSLPVVTGNPNELRKPKSAIHHSGADSDAPDKSFGIEMGGNELVLEWYGRGHPRGHTVKIGDMSFL